MKADLFLFCLFFSNLAFDLSSDDFIETRLQNGKLIIRI